jgi:hypothetical protein
VKYAAPSGFNEIAFSNIGVRKCVGAIALTRIPKVAHSIAKVRVRELIPPLLAE